MSLVKSNDEYVIKKTRKMNCSDVKIYFASSKLAQNKNKEGHKLYKLPQVEKKPKPSKIQQRTYKYKFNTKSIQALKFRNTIDQSEYLLVRRMISAAHKSQTLNKHSFVTFRKYIRNNDTHKINQILNQSVNKGL